MLAQSQGWLHLSHMLQRVYEDKETEINHAINFSFKLNLFFDFLNFIFN